ncbi:MAG TPA: chemotaxis protein CheW [Bacillota bacterium]|nr:chemotaxis protein CheW [Bacillota bacterium]
MAEMLKVVEFQLKGETYGVDIHQVRSIEKLQNVIEVPKTPDFIKGVINLRGDITPIVDLSERLDIGRTDVTEDTRVLIVQIRDIQIGLVVDSATDVIDIDPNVVEKAPPIIKGVDASYIKGVAKLDDTLLILLDLQHVLNLDEINTVAQVIEKER